MTIAANNGLRVAEIGVGKIPLGSTVWLEDDSGTQLDSMWIETTVTSGKSFGLYTDANKNPLTFEYIDPSPTNGTANDTIPEFKEIVVPLVGTLTMYAMVRRRNQPRLKDGSIEVAPA